MKSRIWHSLLLIFALLAMVPKAEATHIRAGEIIAERIPGPGFTYRIVVIAYTDTRSPVPFGAGRLDFGDGRVVDLIPASQLPGNSFVRTELGNAVASNVVTIFHTFQGAGFYTISYREEFRNALVLNMNNSVNTAFYIETRILVDPLLSVTNTPRLLIPPVDAGCTGRTFIHNPGAFDVDGDSLAYSLVVPKQDRNRNVDGYVNPNNPRFGGSNQAVTGPPTFRLDSITGDLIWDSPGTIGQYNVAFIVEEWRKINGVFVQIGYVTRDLQIIIEDCNNDPPDVQIPPDLCVVAGTFISQTVTATDPNGHPVKLESFGGVYTISNSPANFSPLPPVFRPQPTQGLFEWQTNGTHIRERPYQVQFKVSDNPPVGPSLVNIKTWNIQVIGPAPDFQEVNQIPGRVIELLWEAYPYPQQAQSIQIWRRTSSNPYEPDDCETGIRSGYQLVGTVPPGSTRFVDDTFNGLPTVGATYCYRILAVFPNPAGGESIVSREICVQIKVDSPVVTNVDVVETSNTEGQIRVRWTSPFEIDTERFPPPFRYELLRLENLTGNTPKTLVASTMDTIFLDTDLNTENLAYRYQVRFYTSENELVDSSAVASSVRLSATQNANNIVLTWQFGVPWNNQSAQFPRHLIYRNKINANSPDDFVLIDSVIVTGGQFTWTDSGGSGTRELEPGEFYCYYVTTRGLYDIPVLPRPLLNNSQIACQTPRDIFAPCPPVLEITTPSCESFLADKPCGFNGFFNSLRWTPTINDSNCEDDIVGYNVYFSAGGADGEFTKIATLTDLEFIHEGLTSFAGCYKITAVDEAGNESDFSNVVCNDNCPQYDLPNVFTPNGDGFNDTFRAISNPISACPRFVELVRITIVNRWGGEIFTYQSNTPEGIFINWDGKDKNGNEMPAGTYYYQGEVIFNVLDPTKQRKELKGWIQLMR
jgi:gliding motility-associated-like protein